jgi:uncharacterized tellurite resistance protein B-like protein
MHADEFALVRSLVPVAWADGTFEAREKEMLDALLEAYGASEIQKEELRAYASTPKSVDEIQLQDLSAGDRRLLLHLAVILTLADGKQAAEEIAILKILSTRLNIEAQEASEIVSAASARAKENLGARS